LEGHADVALSDIGIRYPVEKKKLSISRESSDQRAIFIQATSSRRHAT
jgi:hypothetical protein